MRRIFQIFVSASLLFVPAGQFSHAFEIPFGAWNGIAEITIAGRGVSAHTNQPIESFNVKAITTPGPSSQQEIKGSGLDIQQELLQWRKARSDLLRSF